MTSINAVAPIEDKQPVAQSMNAATAMTAVFERAAFDPDFSLDRLEKMMEMQERYERREAEKAFSAAFAAAQSEMPIVKKNQWNNQTKSDYADLGAVLKVCQPVLAKHGLSFSMTPSPSKTSGMYAVEYEIRHKDGHTKSAVVEDIPADIKGPNGTVNKTGIHGFGSSMKYAQRYVFCMVFNVAIEGDDDDGNKASQPAVKLISQDQADAIRELLEAEGVEKERFLKYGKIERIEDVPASQYEGALQTIKKMGAA